MSRFVHWIHKEWVHFAVEVAHIFHVFHHHKIAVVFGAH